jgi:hypothetical protein
VIEAYLGHSHKPTSGLPTGAPIVAGEAQ